MSELRSRAIDDLYAVFAPDVVIEAEVEAIIARIVAIDAAQSDLRAALDDIRDMCKPMSIAMSGEPRWFDGNTPAGGGSRERIWRICDAALTHGPACGYCANGTEHAAHRPVTSPEEPKP